MRPTKLVLQFDLNLTLIGYDPARGLPLHQGILKIIRLRQEALASNLYPELLVAANNPQIPPIGLNSPEKVRTAMEWDFPPHQDLSKDGYHVIIPAFFHLLIWLAKTKRPFTLVFRTMGWDLKDAIAAVRAFARGEHPMFPEQTSTQGEGGGLANLMQTLFSAWFDG